jgi:hypothetical protein
MVNGINLLPFVPLDGGWVMRAILFSRHFILETAFLAIAGTSLIGRLCWVGDGYGCIWAFSFSLDCPLPIDWLNLRADSAPAAFPSLSRRPEHPAETALAILRELKALPQEIKLTKHLASQTLSVFQKLNATPPSMAVSVLLILLYIGAGSAAVLGIGSIYAARFNPFPTESEVIWSKPAHSVDAVEIASAGATNATEFSWVGPTDVATFTNAAEAREAFRGVKSQLGSQESLALFGHSVFSSPGSNWIRVVQGTGRPGFR